jgi:hypothetical protein
MPTGETIWPLWCQHSCLVTVIGSVQAVAGISRFICFHSDIPNTHTHTKQKERKNLRTTPVTACPILLSHARSRCCLAASSVMMLRGFGLPTLLEIPHVSSVRAPPSKKKKKVIGSVQASNQKQIKGAHLKKQIHRAHTWLDGHTKYSIVYYMQLVARQHSHQAASTSGRGGQQPHIQMRATAGFHGIACGSWQPSCGCGADVATLLLHSHGPAGHAAGPFCAWCACAVGGTASKHGGGYLQYL